MALMEMTLRNTNRKVFVNPRHVVSITAQDISDDQSQLFAEIVLLNTKQPLRVEGSASEIKRLAERAGV